MISNYGFKLGIAAEPQAAASLQRHDGAIVLPGLELAEPEHPPAGTSLRIDRNKIAEGITCVCVAIVLVENRTYIPPTFSPVRTELQRPAVMSHCFFESAGFTGVIRQLDRLIKRISGLGSRCLCLWLSRSSRSRFGR